MDKKLVVIDPGDNYYQIKEVLGEKKIDIILLTHYHYDHIKAVDKLCKEFNIKAYIHHKGFYLVQKNDLAQKFVNEKISVEKGNLKTFTNKITSLPSLKIFHAPGHSIDSSIFLFDKQLFTGDVLFANTFGRVDLPDSNSKMMSKSLEQISNFSNDIIIYPGHGPSQNLGLIKYQIKKFINELSRALN